MIPFNKPLYLGIEDEFVLEAIKKGKLSGDGPFTKMCHAWFEENFKPSKVLLTPSCTHSLEMAALLLGIQEGDEVIMPSYTFVSTANAFALRGAKIVFVDIRPDTMNIDENLIEAAITSKTKAIVPVHYAGVACEMDKIMEIANRHEIYVVEDAAQGMMSTYKGRALGTIGHFGTISFHETKNYTSGGEGGLLIINDEKFAQRAEIIREKGTNRSLFFRGMVDKYSWVDIGSSYLPSEIQAAYLYGQLGRVSDVNTARLSIWDKYYSKLSVLKSKSLIDLPTIPSNCFHNAHMFYIKVKNLDTRTELIEYLKAKGIQAAFHYVPLHSSVVGKKFYFKGEDKYTTKESERLLRLPLWYSLEDDQLEFVANSVMQFYDRL